MLFRSVREVFTRSINGESQNGITRDLIARGVKTAAGNEWTSLQTSRLLKTPKYAGLQTYKGEVVGKSQVPAIVDEATFTAAQGKATGASYNLRKYLLSGILICDECKNPMSGTRVVNKGTESVRYRCDQRSGGCGKVSIKGAWIDGLIDRYITWAVIYEAHHKPKEEKPVDDNSEAIAELDARIDDLRTGMGDGRYDIGDAMAAIKAARDARKKLVAQDAKAIAAVVQQHPIESYDALSDDEKRVVIRRWFKYIFIRPGKRVRHFDENRVYALMADGTVKPGGAFNTVDHREPFLQGVDPYERGFDPDRGF